MLGNLVTIPCAKDRIYELAGHQMLANFLMTYDDKPRRKAVMYALQQITKFECFRPELPQLIEPLIQIVSNSQAAGTLNLRELSLNILSGICQD
jgi:hypothetical protein